MSAPGPYYNDGQVRLFLGDCLDVLAGIPDCSIDAVVTDPPYALPGGFMGKTWDAFDGREDAGFAYWLSGLIDGEGHFAIKAHSRGTHAPAFTLKMRADEEGALRIIQRHLGIGSIGFEPREPNPMVKWTVQDKAGCQRLVDLLDKYPLRAKKRMDYATWREAVCEWAGRPRGNRWHGATDNSHMAVLRERLMAGRQYVEPAWSGHEFQDWCRLWAAECLRVLKPGGWMLAFGGTRAWHRLACGIEDAGFEIRDSIAELIGQDAPGLMWIHGQGFPKNLDVGKAIDKAAGAQREVVAEGKPLKRMIPGAAQNRTGSWIKDDGREFTPAETAPATADAARWEGWGTALKPAWEPIVVARKPLTGTVTANVLEYGTGALNIAACRVTAYDQKGSWAGYSKATGDAYAQDGYSKSWVAGDDRNPGSRWPPNVLLTHSASCELIGTREVKTDGHHPATRGGSGYEGGLRGQSGLAERKSSTETVEVWRCAADCPVAELDRQSGVLTSGIPAVRRLSGSDANGNTSAAYGAESRPAGSQMVGYGDTGGASRFFPAFQYEAKAPASERPRLADGTAHPTVKPLDLMRWLVRLVTPPGGTVGDFFAGSGTTGEACVIEGFDCILIEKDPASAELIKIRLSKPIQPDLFGGAA